MSSFLTPRQAVEARSEVQLRISDTVASARMPKPQSHVLLGRGVLCCSVQGSNFQAVGVNKEDKEGDLTINTSLSPGHLH